MAIPFVGEVFRDERTFLPYLQNLRFGAWRPQYVVDHHTGSPDLALWRSWQTRKPPVTDEQWLKNLAVYYGSPPPHGPNDGPWQHGPHFMFAPDGFGVLSIPTERGTHAKSFNANSWCVEMVGDFDSEPFDGAVRDKYVTGLACLHIALGLQLEPFELKVRGLHFHRDDPLTRKTCPGLHVKKPELIKLIDAKIDAMTGTGDHPSPIAEQVVGHVGSGTVNTNDLSVRAGPGAKNPVVRSLNRGDTVQVTSTFINDQTRWLNIGKGEWVSARYVDLKPV